MPKRLIKILMNSNKTILVGIIFIIIAGTIFITNTLNPIIRPITYLFLMGSSKGKDIIFFSLLGLFLMLSQAGNVFKKNINENKYLKISILLGCMLLILGILLEILFRYQMGISLNCVFVSMNGEMSSTSILHTHLLKSVIGKPYRDLNRSIYSKRDQYWYWIIRLHTKYC